MYMYMCVSWVTECIYNTTMITLYASISQKRLMYIHVYTCTCTVYTCTCTCTCSKVRLRYSAGAAEVCSWYSKGSVVVSSRCTPELRLCQTSVYFPVDSCIPYNIIITLCSTMYIILYNMTIHDSTYYSAEGYAL